MGTETPTNFPFWSAGPVFGTKFPNIMPTAIARKIHRARNRSNQPSALNAEDFSATRVSCFSGSVVHTAASSFVETPGIAETSIMVERCFILASLVLQSEAPEV